METIIVVHGTFAEDASWWRPSGEFCQALDRLLEERGCGARCWAHAHETGDLWLFRWSGRNSEQDRTDAARAFQACLALALKNEKITKVHVIAHSHGGNVVAEAIKSLFASEELAMYHGREKLGRVVTLGTPFLHFSLGRNWVARLSFAYQVGCLLFLLFGYRITGSLLLDIGLLILGHVPLVAVYALFYTVYGSVRAYPLPRKDLFGGPMPELSVVSSRHDEALFLLTNSLSLRQRARTLAARVAPIRWRPYFLPSFPAFRRQPSDTWETEFARRMAAFRASQKTKREDPLLMRAGTWAWWLIQAIVKLPLLIFDHTVGRVLTAIVGIATRLALIRGFKAVSDHALGRDVALAPVFKVAAFPMGIDCEAFEVDTDVENDLAAQAVGRSRLTVERLYGLIGERVVERDIELTAERLREVFTDSDLVHSSYLRHEALLGLVADIIAGRAEGVRRKEWEIESEREEWRRASQ